MRLVLASLLISSLVGCSASRHVTEVDRVEMRSSGWSAVDVDVSEGGKGHFHLSHPPPGGRNGSFSISPRQFARLVARLQPFLEQAVPLTDASARAFIERKCPKGTPVIIDAGAIWVRWTGPGFDDHYMADLGCDPRRNAARNEELVSIFKSVPVPLD